MRILFVAMSQSIHTARWINQIADEGWDIHLFPSWDLTLHPKLRNITVHGFKVIPSEVPNNVNLDVSYIPEKLTKNKYIAQILSGNKFKLFELSKLNDYLRSKRHDLLFSLDDDQRCNELIKVIKKIKPDIIHSLEIQHAGYLTLTAKKNLGGKFPRWIVTNWGADIHHFGEIPEHAIKIRETLESCDYYGCECQRDILLAKKFGFKGQTLPILTNTGGFDFEYINQFRQAGPSSSRRLILLKGYQGWVYRALTGLQAIEMCSETIKTRGYRLTIYLASPGVPEAAIEFEQRTGIPVEIIPYSSHEHILNLHGQARISIGLSLSDAISTSFLEAIVMGSFPIQSNTSCANEWVTDGKTAFLVPPEDTTAIANAIKKALVDDNLVDDAAIENMNTIKQRLAYKNVQKIVISTYEKIFSGEALEQIN